MEFSDHSHIGILNTACKNFITFLSITVDDIILSGKFRSDVYLLKWKVTRNAPGPVPINYIYVPEEFLGFKLEVMVAAYAMFIYNLSLTVIWGTAQYFSIFGKNPISKNLEIGPTILDIWWLVKSPFDRVSDRNVRNGKTPVIGLASPLLDLQLVHPPGNMHLPAFFFLTVS